MHTDAEKRIYESPWLGRRPTFADIRLAATKTYPALLDAQLPLVTEEDKYEDGPKVTTVKLPRDRVAEFDGDTFFIYDPRNSWDDMYRVPPWGPVRNSFTQSTMGYDDFDTTETIRFYSSSEGIRRLMRSYDELVRTPSVTLVDLMLTGALHATEEIEAFEDVCRYFVRNNIIRKRDEGLKARFNLIKRLDVIGRVPEISKEDIAATYQIFEAIGFIKSGEGGQGSSEETAYASKGRYEQDGLIELSAHSYEKDDKGKYYFYSSGLIVNPEKGFEAHIPPKVAYLLFASIFGRAEMPYLSRQRVPTVIDDFLEAPTNMPDVGIYPGLAVEGAAMACRLTELPWLSMQGDNQYYIQGLLAMTGNPNHPQCRGASYLTDIERVTELNAIAETIWLKADAMANANHDLKAQQRIKSIMDELAVYRFYGVKQDPLKDCEIRLERAFELMRRLRLNVDFLSYDYIYGGFW